MRITSSFREMSLKIPEVTSLNWIRISTLASFNAVNENQIKEAKPSVLRLLTLSGLQNKRNALPAWVVDPQCRSGKRRANRITGNGLIVQVSWLPVRSHVLSQQGILPLNWGDSAQNFDLIPIGSIRVSNRTIGRMTIRYLFVSNVLSRERHRALHGQNGQHLQQI